MDMFLLTTQIPKYTDFLIDMFPITAYNIMSKRHQLHQLTPYGDDNNADEMCFKWQKVRIYQKKSCGF